MIVQPETFSIVVVFSALKGQDISPPTEWTEDWEDVASCQDLLTILKQK